MLARQLLLGTFAAFGLLLGGCDKQAQSNSAAADPTPAASGPQEEARGDLALISMPIVLSAPADWTLKPMENPAYLLGSGPDGDLQISLSVLDFLSDNSMRLYIAAALDQAQRHPRRIQIRQSTTSSGLQILERITYADLPETPADQPAAATEPSEPLAWSIIIFVPFQKRFIPCRFDLLKLTQKEYDDDQQFVESVIDTARAADLAEFK